MDHSYSNYKSVVILISDYFVLALLKAILHIYRLLTWYCLQWHLLCFLCCVKSDMFTTTAHLSIKVALLDKIPTLPQVSFLPLVVAALHQRKVLMLPLHTLSEWSYIRSWNNTSKRIWLIFWRLGFVHCFRDKFK